MQIDSKDSTAWLSVISPGGKAARLVFDKGPREEALGTALSRRDERPANRRRAPAPLAMLQDSSIRSIISPSLAIDWEDRNLTCGRG
jgi:hypothetical protein